MRSFTFTCVSVVACVTRKLRPCPSYSRRRDRINLVLWRSLYKGGGGMNQIAWCFAEGVMPGVMAIIQLWLRTPVVLLFPKPAGLAMPAMLIGLSKIPQILSMAAFATSLLSILDPNTHSNPSLG